MAGLLDFLSNMSPDENRGLLAAASQILQASGPSRMPTSLGQIAGVGMDAYQQSAERSRLRRLQEQEAAQMAKYRGLQIQNMESDNAAQQLSRERAQRIASRLSGVESPAQTITAPPQMASALPGGEGSPKTGGPGWLQAYEQQNGRALAQSPAVTKPVNQTDAYVQRLLASAQVFMEEGDIEGANKLYEQASKLRPKVKEYQKVKKNGKVFNQPFFEDGNPGEVVGEEIAQNLNWQDVGPETLGLDPTYGTVVARQKNGVSPNTAANVAASYANAAATRATADATRDAARLQYSQGIEMKLADDYRNQSKPFKDTADAYRQLTSTLGQATKSPAATLAAATKFMKLLDPGSVVRESELGMALAASGVFDRATNYFNVLQKGRVLTPDQAADFKNITEQIYGAAAQGQQAIDSNYRRQAATYGLRPDMILQDLGQNRPTGQQGSNAGQGYADPEKERRYQEWKRSQGK